MKCGKHFFCVAAVAALLLAGCAEDLGLKGRVRLSISGSVPEDPAIAGVNLIITGLEARRDGNWRALRGFDQPVGVNLTTLTGGQSFSLIDQFIDPGVYTEVRVSVLMADPKSAVLRSPISTVDFNTGVSQPIFLAAGETSFTVPVELSVSERGVADYNLAIDVRKSVLPAAAETFAFEPQIRLVNVVDAGNLSGRMVNVDGPEALQVFVYKTGEFTLSDAALNNGVRFRRAVDSGRVRASRFQIGFLPAGTYDLVFATVDAQGRFTGLRGVARNVAVAARQTATRDIDMKSLSNS